EGGVLGFFDGLARRLDPLHQRRFFFFLERFCAPVRELGAGGLGPPPPLALLPLVDLDGVVSVLEASVTLSLPLRRRGRSDPPSDSRSFLASAAALWAWAPRESSPWYRVRVM